MEWWTMGEHGFKLQNMERAQLALGVLASGIGVGAKGGGPEKKIRRSAQRIVAAALESGSLADWLTDDKPTPMAESEPSQAAHAENAETEMANARTGKRRRLRGRAAMNAANAANAAKVGNGPPSA